MRWNDSREAVDIGIGFVGFFALAFLIITVACEVTGQPAFAWAMVLLVLVLVLVLLLQARRRIVASRLRAEEERELQRNS
ncbi:hypothetical protein [Leifsonia sp. AG29]|uniref:hypothetical protein n=1 Tax=Leifsonia sp. AG29 TaxID=2598860 RepID=UPI00131EB92E|nr:hypothetical protein [Leifsonia sp. AG29]